jgi:hypothetical protein
MKIMKWIVLSYRILTENFDHDTSVNDKYVILYWALLLKKEFLLENALKFDPQCFVETYFLKE